MPIGVPGPDLPFSPLALEWLYGPVIAPLRETFPTALWNESRPNLAENDRQLAIESILLLF